MCTIRTGCFQELKSLHQYSKYNYVERVAEAMACQHTFRFVSYSCVYTLGHKPCSRMKVTNFLVCNPNFDINCNGGKI